MLTRVDPALGSPGDPVSGRCSRYCRGRCWQFLARSPAAWSPAMALRKEDTSICVYVYVLDCAKGEFELFLIRRNTSESTATIDNFVKILAESVLRLQTRCQHTKASRRGLGSEDAKGRRDGVKYGSTSKPASKRSRIRTGPGETFENAVFMLLRCSGRFRQAAVPR
jgi:hypothetical protein